MTDRSWYLHLPWARGSSSGPAITCLLFVLLSACSPRTRYWFDHPGMSEVQFQRYRTECLQDGRKVADSARTLAGAIVYSEATYITCMELKGAVYKGKTVSWN